MCLYTSGSTQHIPQWCNVLKITAYFHTLSQSITPISPPLSLPLSFFLTLPLSLTLSIQLHNNDIATIPSSYTQNETRFLFAWLCIGNTIVFISFGSFANLVNEISARVLCHKYICPPPPFKIQYAERRSMIFNENQTQTRNSCDTNNYKYMNSNIVVAFVLVALNIVKPFIDFAHVLIISGKDAIVISANTTILCRFSLLYSTAISIPLITNFHIIGLCKC